MNARVLVADDDDLIRTFIVLNLGAVGITRIEEATNGLQAWSLAKQEDFDLIVVDWYMPGKNGLELIRDIRSRGSDVPIIMVTAEAMRGQVVEALKAGATDYVVKPFEAATLQAKVVKVLEASRESRQKNGPEGAY